MSTTYTAEQYNQEFNAKRLQNYEIPKPVLAKVTFALKLKLKMKKILINYL